MTARREISTPHPTRVGLGDVRPDATIRLDALARIVQDISDTDATSAPIEMGVWILRRLALDIERTPRFRADVSATTWCSGVGARWAERRTDLRVGDVHCVEATALWVHTDAQTGAPIPIPKEFASVWGDEPMTHKVSSRLQHPKPRADARRERWQLRATDLDVVEHVNNAAYWAAAEEELARRGRPRVTRAEIEFRSGLVFADAVDMVVADEPSGFQMWLCVDGDVRASMLVVCAP